MGKEMLCGRPHDKYYVAKTAKEKTSIWFTSDETIASLYDIYQLLYPVAPKEPEDKENIVNTPRVGEFGSSITNTC